MSGVITTKNSPKNPQDYLQVDEVIDWHHPDILGLAKQLANEQTASTASPVGSPMESSANVLRIAQSCFEWVRDRIFHSFDYQTSPVYM